MNFFIRVRDKLLSLILLRIKTSGYYAVRSLPEDLKVLVDREDPVIVDGGANQGDTTQTFLSQFRQPTIYAFEANKDLTQFLEKKFANKPSVRIVPKALGNQTGQVKFNISNNLPSSSFLERAELNKTYHGYTTATQAEVFADMVKLEDVLKDKNPIDLLKLDVEGYELEVLKGAENILPNIRIIMTEVWFAGGYKDAPHFADIDQYLRAHNFQLLNLYNPYTHPDMQLTAADAVFLNKKYFPDRK